MLLMSHTGEVLLGPVRDGDAVARRSGSSQGHQIHPLLGLNQGRAARAGLVFEARSHREVWVEPAQAVAGTPEDDLLSREAEVATDLLIGLAGGGAQDEACALDNSSFFRGRASQMKKFRTFSRVEEKHL